MRSPWSPFKALDFLPKSAYPKKGQILLEAMWKVFQAGEMQYSPIMENHMENQVEHGIETAVTWLFPSIGDPNVDPIFDSPC